jgi:hypothetical protein
MYLAGVNKKYVKTMVEKQHETLALGKQRKWEDIITIGCQDVKHV